MPILSSARQELFAQGLAAGKTADQAYIDAGYSPDRHHAARLATKGHVRARVEELLGRATQGIVLTQQWVIEKLIENANRAMQEAEVKAGSGEYKYDGAVANRALELLGKQIGMFIERQVTDQNLTVLSGEPMTDEDWEAQYASKDHLAAANGASKGAH